MSYADGTPIFTRKNTEGVFLKVLAPYVVNEAGQPDTNGSYISTQQNYPVQGFAGISTGLINGNYLRCVVLHNATADSVSVGLYWLPLNQITSVGTITDTIKNFQRYYTTNKRTFFTYGSGSGNGYSPWGFEWNIPFPKWAGWLAAGLLAALMLSQSGDKNHE